MREDAGTSEGSAGARWTRSAETVRLDDVARGNDHEHEPELEALDDIGAGELEEVFFFEFLEHCGFDLDELVGY